jgi:hypothetical protein
VAFLIGYQQDLPVKAAFDSSAPCPPDRVAPDCRQSAPATIVAYRHPSRGEDQASLLMAGAVMRDVFVAGTQGAMRLQRGVTVEVESYRGQVVSFTDGQGTAFTSENPDRRVQSDVLFTAVFAVVAVLFGGLTVLVLLGQRRPGYRVPGALRR